MWMTCYRGHSTVIAQMETERFFQQVAGGLYRKRIEEIETALANGDFNRAECIKSKLPYFTLTATYRNERLAYSLIAYNDLLILDFDEMQADDIPRLRRMANEDPNTVGSFLSPRRHGLKLLIYMLDEESRHLRKELEAQGTVTYAGLEQYHKKMYSVARRHYQFLLGSKVDESGNDLSRGVYASYDTQTFFSSERVAAVAPLQVSVTLPTKEECAPKKRKRLPAQDHRIDTSGIGEQAQLDYVRAVDYTRRKYRFAEGGRDNFIYCLGNQCYIRRIPEEEALRMAMRDFGGEAGFDPEPPMRNAYSYTSKTDMAEEVDKKSRLERMKEYLERHYDFRYNLVRDQVEFRPRGGEGGAFATMRIRDLNSLYMKLLMADIPCTQALVKAMIESDYVASFHPFISYFHSLNPWDGVTDYIGQLADTIDTDDPAFLRDALKRWLVGLVACAVSDQEENQLLLLLYSKQGKGKSRFIRNLLPRELGEYYRNGMINPDNKDHMLMLSNCLIINLEEFDGVSANRLADLKRVIAQDRVTERKVFDFQSHSFVRRASFAASTNNAHCLQEIGENRRILFIAVNNIRYRYQVDHAGLYAQALALYREGFQYWYEGEEIERLNARNEHYRLRDPVEEGLFVYYRAATSRDFMTKWLPAASLLANISLNGRIQSNRQALQTLVYVLENAGFRKRVTGNGVTEYAVIEYTFDERTANAGQAAAE